MPLKLQVSGVLSLSTRGRQFLFDFNFILLLHLYQSSVEIIRRHMPLMSSSIPETDGYVKLSLLDGGSMTGSMSMMHAGSPPDQFRLYDWVFYAYNPKQDRHLVWDLGMAAV